MTFAMSSIVSSRGHQLVLSYKLVPCTRGHLETCDPRNKQTQVGGFALHGCCALCEQCAPGVTLAMCPIVSSRGEHLLLACSLVPCTSHHFVTCDPRNKQTQVGGFAHHGCSSLCEQWRDLCNVFHSFKQRSSIGVVMPVGPLQKVSS